MFDWVLNTPLVTAIFSCKEKEVKEKIVFGNVTLSNSKILQTAKKVELGWMTPTTRIGPISLKLI